MQKYLTQKLVRVWKKRMVFLKKDTNAIEIAQGSTNVLDKPVAIYWE